MRYLEIWDWCFIRIYIWMYMFKYIYLYATLSYRSTDRYAWRCNWSISRVHHRQMFECALTPPSVSFIKFHCWYMAEGLRWVRVYLHYTYIYIHIHTYSRAFTYIYIYIYIYVVWFVYMCMQTMQSVNYYIIHRIVCIGFPQLPWNRRRK